MLLNYILCTVCHELARDAIECSTCNHILCGKCSTSLVRQECPSCRSPATNFKACTIVRRMIGSLQEPCSNGCGAVCSNDEMSYHLKICPKRKVTCTCGQFTGLIQDFFNHVNIAHFDAVLKTVMSFDKAAGPLKSEDD